MSRGRVLVAMSGGVDSSVAAWLLMQQGYECVGATMRLAANEDDRPGERTCCSVDDVADAREACWTLGIRHHVFDYTRQFARDVIQPFIADYEAGRTPNPCVACNRYLKFGALLDRARELGCDYLATGHYARVERMGGTDAPAAHGPAYRLLKGVDAAKDQSYFLYGLTHERMHGEHVHRVVVALGTTRHHAIAQVVVVDDVIAAHEARQVEGLGRRVDGHGAIAGVLAHALRRDVLVARQDDVAPDLV